MIGYIIGLIITGLIIGALARLVIPGRQSMSIVVSIAFGMVAALVAGLIAHALGLGAILTYVVAVVLAAAAVYFISGSGGEHDGNHVGQDGAQAQRVRDQTGNQRRHHANSDGHDDAHRLAARDHKPGQGTDDAASDDEADDVADHAVSSLSAGRVPVSGFCPRGDRATLSASRSHPLGGVLTLSTRSNDPTIW